MSAIARPRSRLRTCASPAGSSESGCTYHGPAARRPARTPAASVVAALGAHLQVVVQHDRLTVEDEPEPGIRVELIEHRIDRVDEAAAELFEGAVPLAIPMEVRDEVDVAHTAMT